MVASINQFSLSGTPRPAATFTGDGVMAVLRITNIAVMFVADILDGSVKKCDIFYLQVRFERLVSRHRVWWLLHNRRHK